MLLKNKFAFTLVEVVIAWTILTVWVFWIYKMIWSNMLLLNKSQDTVDAQTLLQPASECIKSKKSTINSLSQTWFYLTFWNEINSFTWCLINTSSWTVLLNWVEYEIFWDRELINSQTWVILDILKDWNSIYNTTNKPKIILNN